MWKEKIYLVQKGPEQGGQDTCPKIGSRKGDPGPKMGGMKVPVRMEGHCFSVQTGPRQCQSMWRVCPNSSPFIRWHNTWNATISPQLKEELSLKNGANLVGGLWGPGSQGPVLTPQHTSVQVISDSIRCEPWLHAWKKEKWMTDVELEDMCWGLGICSVCLAWEHHTTGEHIWKERGVSEDLM